MNNDQIVEVMARSMTNEWWHPSSQRVAILTATNALTALREAGYEVVPVEPTEAMQNVISETIMRQHPFIVPQDIYRMAINARDEGETK